jgi:Cupin domain
MSVVTAHPRAAVQRPALVLDADAGRTPFPLNAVGEAALAKVAAADSDGTLSCFHLNAPPMSGPPRHVYSRDDELFDVLDGALVFEIDGVRHEVSTGGTLSLPRGIVRAYQNFTLSDDTPVRVAQAAVHRQRSFADTAFLTGGRDSMVRPGVVPDRIRRFDASRVSTANIPCTAADDLLRRRAHA